MQIAAGRFKAQCLRLMDEVQRTGRGIVVTKRGKAVVRVVPARRKRLPDVFGCMRGTITIKGDLLAPLDEKWEADQ